MAGARSNYAPGDWRQAVKAKRWGPLPPAGTIIGNKNSLKYHRPDCAGYRDMAEKNRVFFPSVAEAEAAGYKRAGNCPAEVASAPGVIINPGLNAASAKAAAASSANTLSANGVSSSSTASTPASTKTGTDASETIPGDGALKDLPPTDEAVAEADESEEADGESTPAATPIAGQTGAGQTNPGTAGIKPGIAHTPSTMPTVTTVAQPNGAGALTANASGPIIGNKNSKVYHLPGCASYNRVSEKNQVKFATIAEAESAGYKLAGNCSKNK